MNILEAPNWPIPKIEIGEIPIIKRQFYWGTMTAYFLITFIGSTSTYFSLQLTPLTSYIGVMNVCMFLTWNILTLTNLYMASVLGAGYVEKGWKAKNVENVEEKLQYCQPCGGYKVPRSHHCSKCNRCCLRMDHHCPWINNCVGHRNQFIFMRFLFFAIIGCIHACNINFITFYYAINAAWFHRYGNGTAPIIVLSFSSFLLVIFSSAMAIAVVIALSILLFTQVRYVYRNMNGIEEYIDGKAKSARIEAENLKSSCSTTTDESELSEYEEIISSLKEWKYPYDLGWILNFEEVMSNVISGRPKSNGVWWPTREGCDQFTFTIEQLNQKKLKHSRSRQIIIEKDFAGKICSSLDYGIRIFCRQPILDGKSINVKVGEKLIATRGSNGWIYGFKENNPSIKGWVPIECTNMKKKNQ